MALGVGHIDVEIALMQKQDELENISIQRGAMQEVVALVIGDQGIGTVGQKQRDNVQVAFLRGPENWSRERVPTSGVDRSPGLQEEVTEGIVAVDCSPLDEALLAMLLVGLHCWRMPRTCRAVMPWLSVELAVYFPLSNSFWIARSSPSRARPIRSSSIARVGGGGAIFSSSRAASPALSAGPLLLVSLPIAAMFLSPALGEPGTSRVVIIAYTCGRMHVV